MRADQSLFAWLAVVGDWRTIADFFEGGDEDDVLDPFEKPFSAYQETADALDALTRRFSLLVLPG